MNSLYISQISLKTPIPTNSYLNKIPAVACLSEAQEIKLSKNVTFIMGENGTGKSTLIEAIAVNFGFNPEGGSRNFNFSTRESHSDLWQYIGLTKGLRPKDGYFLRAESFYNVASQIEEMDEYPAGAPKIIGAYGGTYLHRQSHGESFMALVQNRFSGNGLYILDEPEAALSPMRQLTLLSEIDRLAKNNSQFIVATHSPILSAYPGAEILELTENGIVNVPYTQTEHYKITKDFLDNPERMFKYLFD